MKVLLISPNTLREPYPVYPLGLDYVAAALDDAHQVRIVDLNCTKLSELEEILQEFDPAVIGISCRNIDNTDCHDSRAFIGSYRELIQWLRQRSPATIVCGGAGFTIMPERIFADLDADYGIVGEGERFGLLVDALAAGTDPSCIEGVFSRLEPMSVPPPWPEPPRRRIPAGPKGHHLFYVRQGGMLNLQAKRGCCFSCIYCPYPHIEGRHHRLTDPDEVARTARNLEEAGARYLFFTDSAFNSDIAHSLAVARSLKGVGLTIPWGGFFAPIRLPDDYFQSMADCGLAHVEFGTESLSPSMLTTYHKPFGPKEVSRAHVQARAAGIHTAHYFLLGGPGESRATVEDTLAGLEQFERGVFFFFTGIRIYPNTRLYEIALAEGKINPDTDLLKPVFYRPDAISLQEIRELVEKRARGRMNWVVGSGGEESAALVGRLHSRGFTGPLWEYLAR